MKVCSTISLPLPLPSFKALLSHIAYRKFQSYLSTASSQSGALPRAAGDVSDLIALLLGKPTAKPRKDIYNIQISNISLLRKEKTTGRIHILTRKETKYFQFCDFPKIAKKTPSIVKRSDSILEHLLSKRAFSSLAKTP